MTDISIIREYEDLMEHHIWIKKIPRIRFPTSWEVQISPPFAGAVVRFSVFYINAEVSIYLDCYDRLGSLDSSGSPYWEVYPYYEDVFRCDINDTESLLNAISESIRNQNDS